MVGVTVGVVTGLACRRRQLASLPNITENQTTPSGVGGEVIAGVIPEYEEISLHEAKDIHITENAAYGCKSS